MSRVECVGEKVRVVELEGDMVERVREADRVWVQHDDGGGSVCTWKPSSQHAGEKRGVAGLLLGRTERAARAAELQLCAQAR